MSRKKARKNTGKNIEELPKHFWVMIWTTTISFLLLILLFILSSFFSHLLLSYSIFFCIIVLLISILYWVLRALIQGIREKLAFKDLSFFVALVAFIVAGIFAFSLMAVEHPLLRMGLYASCFFFFGGLIPFFRKDVYGQAEKNKNILRRSLHMLLLNRAEWMLWGIAFFALVATFMTAKEYFFS